MLKFELSEQMVQIIGQALGAAPYQAVKPIIDELQRQIDAQKPRPNGGGEPFSLTSVESDAA